MQHRSDRVKAEALLRCNQPGCLLPTNDPGGPCSLHSIGLGKSGAQRGVSAKAEVLTPPPSEHPYAIRGPTQKIDLAKYVQPEDRWPTCEQCGELDCVCLGDDDPPGDGTRYPL